MKSLITVANKLSSILIDTSVVGKAIRKNDDIIKNSILVDVDTSLFRYYNRTFSDNFNLTDSTSLGHSKFLDESVFAIESTAFNINKSFFDIFSISDSFAYELIVFAPELTILDSINLQDLFTIVLNKDQFDIFTPDDFISKDYSKILSDIFETLDVINNQITKNISDSFDINSLGSLISQNYTIDNSYFLEVYVGESRIFT